jgi:hypothetical protein
MPCGIKRFQRMLKMDAWKAFHVGLNINIGHLSEGANRCALGNGLASLAPLGRRSRASAWAVLLPSRTPSELLAAFAPLAP